MPLTPFKSGRVWLSLGSKKQVIPQRSEINIFGPRLFENATVQRDESVFLVLHPVAPALARGVEVKEFGSSHGFPLSLFT
ncbi:hypothetical protein [Pantoea ananatis]